MKKRYLYTLLLPSTILALWFMLSEFFNINSIILPHPFDVFNNLILQFSTGGLLGDIGWSLIRTLLGFMMGSILGILCGVMMELPG